MRDKGMPKGNRGAMPKGQGQGRCRLCHREPRTLQTGGVCSPCLNIVNAVPLEILKKAGEQSGFVFFIVPDEPLECAFCGTSIKENTLVVAVRKNDVQAVRCLDITECAKKETVQNRAVIAALGGEMSAEMKSNIKDYVVQKKVHADVAHSDISNHTDFSDHNDIAHADGFEGDDA